MSTNQPQAMSSCKKVIAVWGPRSEADSPPLFGTKCRWMRGKQADSMIETRVQVLSGLLTRSAALLTQLPASEWSCLTRTRLSGGSLGQRGCSQVRGQWVEPGAELVHKPAPLQAPERQCRPTAWFPPLLEAGHRPLQQC